MTTAQRLATVVLFGALQLSVLVLPTLAIAATPYPVTLEVRYGVANQEFEDSGAGTDAAFGASKNQSRHIVISVSDGSRATITRDNFRMQYSLTKPDDSDAFLLDASIDIDTSQGNKSADSQVRLAPGQWLIIYFDKSAAESEGHKLKRSFFIGVSRLLKCSGLSQARFRPPI